MTNEEALSILDQATSQVNANREVHDKIREALEIIKILVSSTPETK